MATKPSLVVVALAAIRPKTLPAAGAPVLVGGALAYAHGFVALLPWAAALFGALLIQIFTNLYNDYADFKRGADTEARVGPDRVTQKGWMSEGQVLAACGLCVALSLGVGAYLVQVGGWPILVIGIASLVSGYLYTGGPFPLAYTGLGDLFVLVFFGEVAVVGTYYLISGVIHPAAFVCGAVIGLPITAILVVNNLRDVHTDAVVGKRTLVVRFGEAFGRFEYGACLFGAYVCCALGLLWGVLPVGAAVVFVALPLAVWHVQRLRRLQGADLNPVLGMTARHGLLISCLLSVGVLL